MPHRKRGVSISLKHAIDLPLAPTLRRFSRRLRLVARNAQCLQVGIIISPALGDVDDVVNFEIQRDELADLAGVLVADQDQFALSPPWATAPP